MAIIKGSLTYNGEEASLPLKEIELEFSLPSFKYEQNDKSIQRIELQPVIKTISRPLTSKSYKSLYSAEFIIGKEPDLFWAWVRKAMAHPFSVDELNLKIPYSIFGPNKVNIGQGCISAFFSSMFCRGQTLQIWQIASRWRPLTADK